MRLIAVTVIYSLAVLGGMILLIIPGIYIAIRYCFASTLIVDKKMGIGEAFAKSRAMTEGKMVELFLFFILSGLLVLSGLIALGVGIVVTFIIFELAFLHLYKSLLNQSEEQVSGGQMEIEEISTLEQ